MKIEQHKTYYVKVTTDVFQARVIRKLVPGVDPIDDEVGDMYEVAIQVYADEFIEDEDASEPSP